MESIDMDISTSDENKDEEDEDDDEEDIDKLLSSLNGLEHLLRDRVNNESKKTVAVPEIKNDLNKSNNNEALKENRAETFSKTNSTRHEVVECNQDNLMKCPVITVSPTSSNASTLSRESTPEKRLSHCPIDCENNVGQSPERMTVAQLIGKDSDSDVIIEHINEYPKNLEKESCSDHSDITYLGTNSAVVNLDAKSSDEFLSSPNPVASAKRFDSVLLDATTISPTKSSRSEVNSVDKNPTVPQSEQTNKNSVEDDDSDSDCLIVGHIAASDHRQNGLIDLTKPTSDEETSLPLQERTEESLLKEISKIRKALTKHSKKKQKKEKRYKNHRRKKRSKSKNRARLPSLEKISENESDENESRTIMMSKGGLRVNITNRIPPESEYMNCEENSTTANENLNTADENLTSTKENGTERDKLPENTCSENKTDFEESPPVWSSDGEDTVDHEKLNSPPSVISSLECNPLRRKLSSFTDDLNTRQPLKKIFCESGKELKSKFRRNARHNNKRETPFDKTSKFNRYLSLSDDSDSNNKKRHQRVPSIDKFNRFMADSDSDKRSDSIASKKIRKVADSDDDDINPSRMKSPAYSCTDPAFNYKRDRSRSIHRDKHRIHRSRSQRKSDSRSPICYRSQSRSSYKNSLHSRSSKCFHKTPGRGHEYNYGRSTSGSCSPDYESFENRRSPFYSHRSKSRSRRSKSRTYRSPSRSRRSKSRTYRSPSRSRRSKSRTYRSPPRSRRSKSRTYRSPSRSRRSKSRTYRSRSRSHRSKSRRRSPRRRSKSRSPSEIRTARKWSPLEDIRQQLKKNNEAAVQQALGVLQKTQKNAAGARMIIDDVDLTNSPPPESIVRNVPTASASTKVIVFPQHSSTHFSNTTALPQNYPDFLDPFAAVRPTKIRPHASFMPMPLLRSPAILNQSGIFQINHVHSQAAGPPEIYVPVYSQSHPPYI